MDYNFELFSRSTPTSTSSPRFSLNLREASFNRPLMKMLDQVHESPTDVQLYFDKSCRIIGLKPGDSSLVGGFRLREAGHAHTVSIRSFVQYYGLDEYVGGKFENIEVRQGLVVIHLNDPLVPIIPPTRRTVPARAPAAVDDEPEIEVDCAYCGQKCKTEHGLQVHCSRMHKGRPGPGQGGYGQPRPSEIGGHDTAPVSPAKPTFRMWCLESEECDYSVLPMDVHNLIRHVQTEHRRTLSSKERIPSIDRPIS